MSSFTVVDREVEAFDTVSLNPDGRLHYADGRLTAIYPDDAEEQDFVVALFHYSPDDAAVSIPEGGVVLGVGGGIVTALVPPEAYTRGDND